MAATGPREGFLNATRYTVSMAAAVLIGLGAGTLVAWAYLLLFHSHFWRIRRVLPSACDEPAEGKIVAVIPARNEAESIAASISSLLQQRGAKLVRIFLVDDGSTDGTAERARESAERAGAADRLTVIRGEALPPGWTGKVWAMQQGIASALELNPEFLLLTDADVSHSLTNVADLVTLAQRGNYDLVSLMVKLHCESIPEKLLIPAFVFFFFKLYPPRWVSDPKSRTAGAAGGCMLIRPEALKRAGGMEAIRGEIIDDCALAKAVKRTGGRVWLGLAPETRSLRRYSSFAEIGRVISRTAFNQLEHSALLLLLAVFGLCFLYLLPVGLVFSGTRATAALGGTSWLLMALAYLPMVRFYGINPVWAVSLPLAALFYMGATVQSALNYWRGRGGEWKGRIQD